jgi:hypothetical protein
MLSKGNMTRTKTNGPGWLKSQKGGHVVRSRRASLDDPREASAVVVQAVADQTSWSEMVVAAVVRSGQHL